MFWKKNKESTKGKRRKDLGKYRWAYRESESGTHINFYQICDHKRDYSTPFSPKGEQIFKEKASLRIKGLPSDFIDNYIPLCDFIQRRLNYHYSWREVFTDYINFPPLVENYINTLFLKVRKNYFNSTYPERENMKDIDSILK